MDSELLAQIVDLLAVQATGHVLKSDPWRVPRPDWMDRARQQGAPRPQTATPAEIKAFFARGVSIG